MRHLKTLAVWLATGLGAGYSPIASGTVGSLWGVLLVLLINPRFGPASQLAIAAGLTVLSVPICDVAEKHFGKKDDGRIVADEYLTFPICMIGLPTSWPVLAVAFVSNRVFDIIKPPPARGIQNLRGGLGVVADDFIATLYSLAFNHAVYWLIIRRFFGH